MKDDLDVMEKYKNGCVVKSDDESILEEYRLTGLVKFGMKFQVSEQGEKIIPTARLTPLGERYLYEKKAENSFMGKLFRMLPI